MRIALYSAASISILFHAFTSAHALTHGRIVHAGEHPATVKIVDEITGGVGSGVVIGPRTILTAAHCVARGEAQGVRIAIGRPVRAKRVITAPPGQGAIALDLAIIETEGPLGIEPYELADEAPAAGEEVTLLGHGPAFSADGGALDDRELKRVGENTISQVNATYLNIEFNSEGAFDAKQPSGAQPGDSGGPMLDRDGKLVGIASKSLFGMSNYVNLFSAKAKAFLKKNAVR